MSELASLLVDEDRFDEAVLAGGLRGVVAITSSGAIRPLDAWPSLSEKGKVLALLLGLRAAEALGKRANAQARPTDVAQMSGVAVGTVKRCLRELAADRLVVQPAKGTYSISSVALTPALDAMRRSGPRRG